MFNYYVTAIQSSKRKWVDMFIHDEEYKKASYDYISTQENFIKTCSKNIELVITKTAKDLWNQKNKV